jgi:dUTP pyrophosphatase|nr:MAG TPA: dUTPase [Bacteriophage sp.]
MKIKVKEITKGCFPVVIKGKGDFIDLVLAEDAKFTKKGFGLVSLGVAMELPKGMIAKVVSRSSTPAKYNVIVANSVGIIDNVYNGDNDEWKAPLYALKATTIPKGTRICQFEVVPSQFATFFQKLRWMLSKPKLVKVNMLGNKNRGGFGSTGQK